METSPLKSFGTWARRELITQVSARLTAVLAPASPERVENQRAVTMLERDIAAAGGGAKGKDAVADKVAYTWFNRIIALRFMDANGYTGVGVVSPAHGQQTGQPEILADAKRGSIDPAVVSNKRTLDAITGLLDGTRPSTDAQGEAYTLLLAEYCRYWNRSMPFMFEREGDYTELLIPSNLLAADSILSKAASTLTAEVCRDVEVIGWLYQFYIAERKDEVFAGFKKGKKAGAAEIPAATQLFTPHWIVRYLVENSLGRLWMLNHPSSRLIEQMDYYVAPLDEETDFLTISSPEELKIIDPACGSGHMLTYAFDLLYAIYEEEGYAPSEIPELILTHNIYGTEIDPRAGALAAFALTMKARARQRTFLSRRVEPNICVIGPIAFSPDDLDSLVTRGGDKHAEQAFWNQFARADLLGALIDPDPDLSLRLAQHVSTLDDKGDLIFDNIIQRARRALRQAEFLTPRYAVVVANPPYMGSKNMDPALAAFAKLEYADSKSDLFAMFIHRCLDAAVAGGLVGLMTPFVWMFIGSYLPIRKRLVERETVMSLIQLEYSGFDGATVPICAYVAQRGHRDVSAAFVRLSDFIGPNVQGPKALEIIQADRRRKAEPSGTTDGMERHMHRVNPGDFAKVPGHPFAYWLSSAMRNAFTVGKPLRTIAEPKVGLQTGDVNRYLRRWWEVSGNRLATNCESAAQLAERSARWIPYDKGGDFRKWYGNQEFVLDWESNGNSVRKNPSARPQNTEYFFRKHIGMTAVSSGDPAFRMYPVGFAFDNASRGLFIESEEISADVIGFANSIVALSLLKATSPTLNYNVDEMAGLPVCAGAPRATVEQMISAARMDWDSFETSWNFVGSSLRIDQGKPAEIDLGDRAAAVSAHWATFASSQQARESENNRTTAEAYGLEHEVDVDVALHRVSLARNVEFRYGPGKKIEEYLELENLDSISELVSYAVGCMFGRYSLDKPGLILADQGATLQDYIAKVSAPTFAPDADNVLPIVDGDWFEDDIVARLRQFLRAAFGEQHFEDNLRFVEESLGVKNLREYFVTRAGRSRFYDDHVKRYKKRPIYWLFSSPKGSFNALIYMHRYTPSTVSTVLNEYLREFESKLEANLQHQERLAAGDGTPREKAAALKEAERLRKVLVELSEYEHDVLYPLASQQVAIDLDDGVKANYPKFYPALKKIAGLEANRE